MSAVIGMSADLTLIGVIIGMSAQPSPEGEGTFLLLVCGWALRFQVNVFGGWDGFSSSPSGEAGERLFLNSDIFRDRRVRWTLPD